jgi:hypothetical protein
LTKDTKLDGRKKWKLDENGEDPKNKYWSSRTSQSNTRNDPTIVPVEKIKPKHRKACDIRFLTP